MHSENPAAAKVAKKARKPEGNKDWAHKLRAMYLAGERLLPVQIDMASGALGEIWKDGQCVDAHQAAA